jgi:hypothetical protein
VQIGLNYLNLNQTNNNSNTIYELNDFLIGFFRSDPIQGFQYELYYKPKEKNCCAYIKLNRPLSNSIKISDVNSFNNNNSLDYYSNYEANMLKNDDLIGILDNKQREIQIANSFFNKKIINFILPLSDSVILNQNSKLLRRFLSIFDRVCLKQDSQKNQNKDSLIHFVTLTIVLGFMDVNSKKKLEQIVGDFKHRTNFSNLKLIFIQSETFSRAKLLQIGADRLKNLNTNNKLMFFCDVDIVFNQMFLDLCRTNAIRNKRVFFPILFSYYNPKFPEQFDPNLVAESLPVNLVINNRDVGFWRDTGFGMTCMYQEDFQSVGGFGEFFQNQKGWGGEDLYLYRQFIKRSYKYDVFRSITPGLFHIYHPKHCDKALLDTLKFRNCLNMKILNEASQLKFGLTYLNHTNQI